MQPGPLPQTWGGNSRAQRCLISRSWSWASGRLCPHPPHLHSHRPGAASSVWAAGRVQPLRTPHEPQEAQSHTVHKCLRRLQPPCPACCPGQPVLTHRSPDLEDPMGGRIRQHSGPFQGGGPRKTTLKEALRPLLPATGSPRAISCWGQSLMQVLLREPHSVAPPGVSTPHPSSGVSATPGSPRARPTAGPPGA